VLLRSLKTALTEELNCKFNPARYRFFSSFCTDYRRAAARIVLGSFVIDSTK
jgi:hypothetical protein